MRVRIAFAEAITSDYRIVYLSPVQVSSRTRDDSTRITRYRFMFSPNAKMLIFIESEFCEGSRCWIWPWWATRQPTDMQIQDIVTHDTALIKSIDSFHNTIIY